MNYEQFAMWLHGFFEISDVKTLNEKQTQIIKDHLALLFKKVTPDRTESTSHNKDMWEELKKAAEKANQDRRKRPSKWPDTTPEPYKPTYCLGSIPKIDPDKIVCELDSTGTQLPNIGNSICHNNNCDEIALGKQFIGVDMKFNSESHKPFTIC